MNVFSLGTHGYRISLHVGSGGVSGVCLKQEKKGGQAAVVYSHRSDVPIREHVQAKTLELHTGEAIERVLKDMHDHVKHHISRVDVVYTSPWFSSRTKTVLLEHSEPFVVTKKLIDDVMRKEIEALKRDVAADDVIMEQKITRIRLNGYESNAPLLKKVHQCELTLFASFAAKDFIAKTNRAIEKIISPHQISFHSFPYVSFSVMSRVWHTDQYFAYVDVGAEVTEVVCSDHGALSESFSFPVGVNHLVRAIAKKREIPNELALSLLSLYGRGAADGETSVAIDSILSTLREEWVAYIDQIIRDSGGDHAVVQKMYVSADDAVLPLWVNALGARAHSVVALTPETLKQFVQTSSSTPVDTLNLLESIFVDSPDMSPHLQSVQN